MDRKNAVVLGGGITGLTAAHELCKKGFNVTLIEKNDFVGGLAATFSHGNYLLDYGPHNFHTHIPEVLDYVKNGLGVRLEPMSVASSRLFFMGKFVNYPLKINDAVRNLDWKVSLRCFADYLASRIYLKLPFRGSEDSFEEWVENRFGRYLYDLYFGPYVNKVWGIPGSELDASVARKRIPEPSLFSLIVRSISGIRHGKRHSEDPEAVDSYYPPRGIGTIAEELKKRISALGGVIELGCRIDSITAAAGQGGGKLVSYKAGGADKKIRWDYLVSTIPINDLFSTLRVPGAEAVHDDIKPLRYRSIILLYMFLSVKKVFDVPWIYFNDKDSPDLIFNRMYEIGNFSEEMIHGEKGVMCLEITCYEGDEVWKKTDGELFETCMAYLEKNGFVSRKDVTKILTKRLAVAYPVFTKGYHARLKNPLRFFAGRGDIFCVGRQGLFSYANVDHCIDMGLKIRRLFEPGAKPTDFYRIYKEYIY